MRFKVVDLTVLTLMVFIAIMLSTNITYAEKSFKYVFNIDDDGKTNVTIFFYDREDGSSWLLVPKDQKECLELVVYEGELLNLTYSSLMSNGAEDPFYVIMEFSYKVSEAVNLTIRYSMKYGALVIEPKAIFISPRIVHEKDQTFVVAYLPGCAQTSENKVSTFSGYIENISITRESENIVVSAVMGSNDRLIVEYTIPKESNLMNATLGKFVFKVHPRYLDLAYDILNTLNKAYTIYSEIFGCELDDVYVEFFVPSREDIVLGIKGYVPVVGNELGPIHLNILYIRSIEGFINVIALHELTHHFLWSINVPTTRLWIHEGIAQYMSLMVGSHLGYHDAVKMHVDILESSLSYLDSDLSFVKGWLPSSVPPQELGRYYSASYYIVKTLCDEYGGFEYLKKLFNVFKQFDPIDWHEDSRIIEAFGKAAGDVDGVVELFRKWGFKVEGSSSFILSIFQIKERISKMPSWLEPYKKMAEIMIVVAEVLQERGSLCTAVIIAKVSQLIQELSFFLMLTSITIVIIAIVVVLRRTT